jgi:hypothetical protein
MQRHPFRVAQSHVVRPLLMSVAALTTCAAYGADDPNPYYIGVSEALTHDSNVFRIANGPADSYSTTSLLGGFDQPIGRQHVYANASVGLNRFRDQTELNNTSYGLAAGWDWSTIEKLSGSVTAGLTQALASFTDSTTTPLQERNLVKTERFGASAQWGGDSILTLNGSYDHSKVSYSATADQNAESTQDSGSLGVYYRLGGALRVGTALRLSHTNSPQGVQLPDGSFDANKANGRNIDVFADWQPTAQTFLNTRISWTRQTNSQVGGRDFSGVTGAISGSYAVTGKISLTGSLSRDAGINGSFFTLDTNPPPSAGAGTGSTTPAPVTGLSQSSQVANNLSITANYAATAKISATAGMQLRRAKLVDSTTTVSNEQDDNSRLYSLGVNYAITRSWLLACNFAHSSRDLSGTGGFTYSANTTSCSAQFTLR